MKSRNHRVTLANLVAIVGYAVASTAGVPAEQQGLATRLVTMSQQVGIALRTLGGCGIIARANGTPARRGEVHDRATGWQWAGLALLVLPMLMLSTDLTVLFLALPTLSQDPSTA